MNEAEKQEIKRAIDTHLLPGEGAEIIEGWSDEEIPFDGARDATVYAIGYNNPQGQECVIVLGTRAKQVKRLARGVLGVARKVAVGERIEVTR